MGDISYFESLAREYKRRAEGTCLWTDYVKAHGLANFCVVKDSTEDRRKLVYNIEESWYKGRHPLSYDEHQLLIVQHKSLLETYRNQMAEDYNELENHIKSVDESDILCESNLKIAQSFCDRVFVASKKCSNGLVDVSKSILQSSVDVLKQIKLEAPCKFAAIGLGSIAKGEATPYSDLEYAFIVERDDPEYFEKLAVDSYFRIGNIGETPLKYFDVVELKDTKCPPPVSAKVAAGYRIDGLMEKAGNIPTGNGMDGSQSLTLTVDEFIALYRSSATKPFDGKPGDLSDLLASSVVIYTNEGDESLLHEEFKRKRVSFESNKDELSARCINEKRFKSFETDIKSATFSPNFVEFQPPKNTSIKLKQDLFRYPTLLANNIKMLKGLDICFSWDVFAHLQREGILPEGTYRYLNILLALAIYIRAKDYLDNKAQVEYFALIPATQSSQASSVRSTVFILFGSLFLPIKQSIQLTVERMTSHDLNINRLIATMLQKVEMHIDQLQIAEVCYFAGQYRTAKRILCKALASAENIHSCKAFLHDIRHIHGNIKRTRKYVQLCCYILYHTKHYDAADGYFQWLIENEQTTERNTILWMLLHAHCKKEQLLYQQAREIVDKVVQQKEQHAGNEDHSDMCNDYINIAIMFGSLSEFRQAYDYLNTALEMNQRIDGLEETPLRSLIYNQIGIAHNRLGDYRSSLKYCTESLEMNKRIFGEDAENPEIAHSCNTIGYAHNFLGNYIKALEYHKKTLAMRTAIYGSSTKHPEIAHSYNNIGNTYNYLRKYELSLENLKTALQMREALYGTHFQHPHIAKSYNNIANTYLWMGDHKPALEYHTKSLEMRLAIFGETTPHKHTANSYNNLGHLHLRLGNHKQALDYFLKSLDMRKKLYLDDPHHPQIASCYNNIGEVHCQLGNLAEALEFYTNSLAMRERIYIENPDHPQMASIHTNIGNAYYQLSDFHSAVEHHTKALSITIALHGVATNKADLANSYKCIGKAYHQLSQFSLAHEYHTKALDMQRSVHDLQESHPDIAISYDYIGRAHLGLCNYSKAEEYFDKALTMRKSLFGDAENHLSFAYSYGNMGDLHYAQGACECALLCYHKQRYILRAKFGYTCSNTQITDTYNKIQETLKKLC